MTSEALAVDAKRSTAVIVLGAGRSGTSAITRGLGALGVDLGDKLRAPGGKNPTGFFEDEDILALNKRLKSILGVRGHSVRLIRDHVWHRPEIRALQNEAVQVLGRRFGDRPLWGYKYGRTLRMLPFWRAVYERLNLDVRYVVALRNPMSVARSRARIDPQRGRQAWSDLEWLVNVVPYFRAVRGHPTTVMDFDRLVAAPASELERAARDLALPVTAKTHDAIRAYVRDFLQPERRHSRFTRDDLARDPSVNRWVVEGYGLLERVAEGQASLDDSAFWQAWSQLENAVDDLAPLLEEFDALRARLVQARWNPASPVQAARQVWRDARSR